MSQSLKKMLVCWPPDYGRCRGHRGSPPGTRPGPCTCSLTTQTVAPCSPGQNITKPRLYFLIHGIFPASEVRGSYKMFGRCRIKQKIFSRFRTKPKTNRPKQKKGISVSRTVFYFPLPHPICIVAAAEAGRWASDIAKPYWIYDY